MKKYIVEKTIEGALEKANKERFSTYLVLYTDAEELVFKIDHVKGMYIVVPMQKINETSVAVSPDLEEVLTLIPELENKAYEIVNTHGIMGLSQYLFENKGGILDMLQTDTKLSPSESVAMVGLAAKNIGVEIKIKDFTILPIDNEDHNYIYKVYCVDSAGNRNDIYTSDLASMILKS